MKNILLAMNDGTYKFNNVSYNDTSVRDIYIINSDEIERGDWYIDLYNLDNLMYCDSVELSIKLNLKGKQVKKIILTTDQDLIVYGIRAIENTVFEWHVNNPSYERVEVNYEWVYPRIRF